MFDERSVEVACGAVFDGGQPIHPDLEEALQQEAGSSIALTELYDSADGIAAVLDKAGLSPLDRLRLTRELAGLRAELANGPTPLQKLRLASRLATLRKELGAETITSPQGAPPQGKAEVAVEAGAPTPEPPASSVVTTEAIEAGTATRQSTADLYDYDPNRKAAQRKRENAEAMELLTQLDRGELAAADLTREQKAALARYSGTGGNLVGADGKKGSAYEYYTPKPIAEGMWSLLRELGFEGGRVLDPSAGVGIFGATAPVSAAVDAIELNATSGRVNQLVNDGPGYSTTIAPFERVAAATPDETYDAVVTNVPFGSVSDRGGNQLLDSKYRDEPIQNYFILRSLEKLRPGGLAAFITPPRCVSGKGGKEEDLRIRASYLAEFMGAYRLPNAVFGTASADTITDVVVFRKYGRETLDRIAELRESSPATLVEANVQWQPFINGTYFADEGRRFVLGEFQAKDPNKFRDVDRVINDGSMADIAKLLRKFGDSRVLWGLLDSVETSPIVYRDGDTMQHAGRTLELQGGRWVEIARASDDASSMELLASLSTPLGAVNAGVDLASARLLMRTMVETARALDVPDWLRFVLGALDKVQAAQQEETWAAATVGLAVDQAMAERQAEETGFDYLANYPALSAAMQRSSVAGKRPAAALPATLKTAMRKISIHYSKAEGYSGVWRGDVAQSLDTRTDAQRFDAERYQAGATGFVSIDKAREVFGSGFDPLADDAWCVSADGQNVARADDYYVGNYADFLLRIDGDIKAATDETVRSKLLRQKLNAEQRLARTNPSAMSFNLFSPFVTIEEKAEFVRRFVDPRFAVAFDDETGKPYLECEIGSPKTEAERNLKRFAEYLKARTVSTRTSAADKEENPALERQRLAALRALVQQAEAQFDPWVKANPTITNRLADIANDPTRTYFKQVDDDSPLDIPGLNAAWKTHGYQAAWVRKMGRDFSGINGDGVGLGKTSQGLIAIQHAQSIGVKKKTMIVVPNSVLSNWRKESGRVYASTEDCMFVGLREGADGESFKTDPSAYDADLTRVLENRHRKIFVTYEAFQRLRLRPETAKAYDKYLASVDASYAESDIKKKDERSKGFRAELIDKLTADKTKSAAAPFFEDLGVDSLVIDEAHMFKNSRATVEFTGGKFLSLAEPSSRGLDAQAKAWYVRKDAPRRDGVILLSATPITNSPLEVYSMLSLAVGDERLNNALMGVKGADEFMAMMCQLEDKDEETMDGLVKPYKVFTGLNNVAVLRTALGSSATIRDAKDVGAQIVMPEADETPTPVALPKPLVDQLQIYKAGFRYAIDTLMERKENRGDKAAFDAIAAKFGEPMELIGHPFNLINKMTMLIADPELDQRATFWAVSPAQAEKVVELVKAWNAKAPVEDRARKGPHTDDDAVVGSKSVKDGDDKVTVLRIAARAKVDGTRVVLDSMAPEVQSAFEAAAEKAGVDLDCTVPPKLAALIENFQREEANPRGRVEGLPSGRVRQLIFCDVLALHSKIRRLLGKRCGVPASAVAIITGTVNGKPEQILEVQEGFNAEGDGNKYRVIIANEKAEVGINLQKGTQAIHHLTLGWTPDSLTQRNGRGVRQGNQTPRVKVYHYDADGTFDTYKRVLVGKKATWIDSLLDQDGGDSVAVSGGLTREQMESLIDSVGDADAITRAQERAEAAERLARANSNQGKQAVALQTIRSQQQFMGRYPDAKAWAAEKMRAFVTVGQQIASTKDRIANPKATASAVLKNENLLAELDARQAGLRRMLSQGLVIRRSKSWVGSAEEQAALSLDDFVAEATRTYGRNKSNPADMAAERLVGYRFDVAVDPAGEIGNEWQSEQDMAKAMIQQSRTQFERTAKEVGGHSTDVLAAADRGAAIVVDGKVVCEGAFIERQGGLAVVAAEAGGLMAYFVDSSGETIRLAAVDAIRNGTVTLPGAAGYSALVSRAAEIEDAIAAVGAIRGDDAGRLFSASIPAVGEQRKAPIMVRHTQGTYRPKRLPAPHFPFVLPVTSPDDGGPVVKAIAKRQAAIVSDIKPLGSGYYGGFSFVVRSDVSVEEMVEDTGRFWPAVLEFCKAEGLRLTWDDVQALKEVGGGSPLGTMLKEARPFDSKEAGRSATDAEDFKRQFFDWLRLDALALYELGSDQDFIADPMQFLKVHDFMLATNFKMHMLAVQALKSSSGNEAATASDAAPSASKDDPTASTIGITGNTWRWKEEIKARAAEAGGRAIWDGTAECWNVPRAAWEALVARRPDIASELQVVKSSGKLAYGKRRYS